MKRTLLFPAFLTVSSVISAVIYQNPFTYFNLVLSIVLLCIVLFSKNKAAISRIAISALWLLILELVAFVLLLFRVNLYQSSLVWPMYVVFVIVEIFVTPRVDKKR